MLSRQWLDDKLALNYTIDSCLQVPVLMTLLEDHLELVGKRAHDLMPLAASGRGGEEDKHRQQRELNSLVDVLLALGQAVRRGVDRFWQEAKLAAAADFDQPTADAAVHAELEWASQIAGLLEEVGRAEAAGLTIERVDELRAAHEGAAVMGTNIRAMRQSADEAEQAGRLISLEDLMAELGVE